MKKQITILSMLLVCVLLVTGCGKGKTLKCKMTSAEFGDVELSTKFDKDKSVSQKMTMTVDAQTEAQAQSTKTVLDTMLEAQYNQPNIKYESKVNGSKVVVTVEFDAKDLTDEEREDQNLTGTYEDLKKAFEDQGYTCE